MKKKKGVKITVNAQRVLAENGISVRTANRQKANKVKYCITRHVDVYKGYDLLENMMYVRHYIQKKYKINLRILEILLYLTPKQYFTESDYGQMAKNYQFGRIKNIIDTGYVKVAIPSSTPPDTLYMVTTKGRNLVRLFYECLSGESKIPEYRQANPMVGPGSTQVDAKKMEMIKKFNQLEVPAHKKSLFE